MLDLLFALAFIAIGAFLLLQKKQPKAELNQPNKAVSPKDDIKEVKITEKKIIPTSVPLESLRAPSNFPKEVVFYFGSQSGTAEKFCQILDEEAQKIQGVQSTKVLDFEHFNVEEFSKHELAIICMSTHYEGDPCDNSKKVYKWLRDQRKVKDEKPCKSMRYTVFGLGDTSYEQYNVIGRFFNEGLEVLGGERIYKYGEGNAEGNKTEDDFNEWKCQLWKEVVDFYTQQEPLIDQIGDEMQQIQEQIQKPVDTQVSNQVQYPLIVELLNADQKVESEPTVQYEMASKQYIIAKEIQIKQIIQLRQNLDEGSTLEVTYDLKDTGLTYKTAENLAIFPKNLEEDVRLCAKILGVELDSMFVFKSNPNNTKKTAIKHPFPTPISINQALTEFVDLRGPLRKKMLKDLSVHCEDDREKEKLVFLSDAKSKTFVDEIEAPQIGLLDVMQKFTSLKLPLEAFFQISNRLMPRYYTIASSSLKYPQEVKIAISLTQDRINGQNKFGVTSAYLKSIADQNLDLSKNIVTNRIFIKDSNFKQPSDHSKTPIIMIGPGTGVVPFIGFMQEREILKRNTPELNLAEAYLFFGCRKSTSDFIYKEDIDNYKQQGIITDSLIALSREPNQERQYVQDVLKLQKDKVMKVLEEGGNIYLCGNTKMGQDVQVILKEFIGEDSFKSLEKEKRLIKELWG
eukprot:403332775